MMTISEQARRQWYRRRPRKGPGYALHGTAKLAVRHCSSYDRRVTQHSFVAGLCVIFAAILMSPIMEGVSPGMGLGSGVLAEPCVTGNTTTGGEGGGGGGTGTLNITVTPSTDLDITSIFNCDDGHFEVAWAGAVNVSGTIHIGLGTTVKIIGDSSSNITFDTASSSERGTSTTGGGSNDSTSHDDVDGLTAALTIPSRLTSAVVGVGSSATSADTDKTLSFGPIFYVEGGQLFLENMAIRGGFVANSTSSPTVSGGGIHAVDSNVTVTGCEFEDNFAEFLGGGVFANGSTLIVVDSVFRRCRAGFYSNAGDEDVDGAGGGIGVENTDVMVNGSLFEDCYASKKGAGMHQGVGQTSVLGSVFYNNSAGSDNVEDETEIGEGAALSFTTCALSFDGQSTCDVNDTIIAENNVGRKGGAVAIGTGDAPSHVEFHRCTVANTTTGYQIEDDPQGEGGAFEVGRGITLVLSDCLLTGNYCGNKGGVITLSSGGDWDVDPGPTVILRNSTFESNTADLGNAGVVYVGEFAALVVAGDANVFEGNTCGEDGGVFGGTTNSNITVEGGVFKNNEAKQDGGVMWTKGIIEIFGGIFVDNEASGKGGVIISGDDSTTILAGGMFEGNEALDGGVVYVGDGSNLWVEDGEFSENEAGNSGGAFSVSEGGNIQITGGQFSSNEADFGGFLYKEGDGTTTCEGATIRLNKGVDGGAIYAVEYAVLGWACDLIENTALAGPAIYARDNTTVVLRGVSLVDNAVARGSVVFVVNSDLETYQVNFNDTTASSEVSAVQVDADSTYVAEDTSFEGFQGEAVVFSEGILYLDDCDFSGSNASRLVYAQPKSTVIRNTVLGDRNYLALADASSRAGELPIADSLTNVKIRCRTDKDGGSGSPCSEGSVCLQGDLGVYCQCYLRRSSSEQRCVAEEPAAMSLAAQRVPGTTFFPQMLEGDLLLSHGESAASSAASASSTTTATDTTESSASPGVSSEREAPASSSEGETRNSNTFSTTSSNSSNENNINISSSRSSSGISVDVSGNVVVSLGASQIGVVWSVSALQQLSSSGASMMDWTVFPSSGLLLPGKSITLRVVTLPSTSFDGTTSVTFVAHNIGVNSSSTTPNNAQQEQLTSGTSSESQDSDDHNVPSTSELGPNITSDASFNVTFYHCETGQVWNSTTTSLEIGSDAYLIEGCQLCSDVVEGETEGVKCDEPGATIETLPVEEGYWRAARTVTFIRECSNQDACKGGSTVADVQEYCNDGYKGPECAVCVSGYGRGAANECHRCTTSFKAGMYFVIAMASMCSLAVLALLAAYLVGGRRAVSSTVASTKQSVRTLQRRGTVLLTRSDGGGRVDFNSPAVTFGITSNDLHVHGMEMTRRFGTKQTYVRDRRTTSSTGIDTGSTNNLKGGLGFPRKVGGSFFSPRRPGDTIRVASERPDHTVEKTGLAAMVSTQYTDSPPSPTLPAEERRETVIRDESSSHGDNTDVSGTDSHHHANTSSIANQQFTSDIRNERAYEGPSNTKGGLEDSTANAEQPNNSPPLLHWGPDNDIEVEGSRVRRELSMSREGSRAAEEDRDGTAAAKFGKVLTGVPLSKLKIVIVVWQISAAVSKVVELSVSVIFPAAFSNITNVAYPPIYEKFLSIIAVFSLDLTWILSAACLTTNVDFYDTLLMVTIGPLVALGLLRVTFHIGARPLMPVATNVPTVRHAQRRSQSDMQLLNRTKPYGSMPVLQRATTSDNPSQYVRRVLEQPKARTGLQRSRPSDISEDTIAMSRSERQTRWVRVSAAKHRIAPGTSSDSVALSSSGRPATAVSFSAVQHRPAGREAGEELEPSGINNCTTRLEDATVNDQDRVTGYARREGGMEAGPGISPFFASTGRSHNRPQRSLWSVWKAGPGLEADPEQDHIWGLFARHTTMTLILLYLVYSQVSTVVFQTFSCEPFPEINKHYLRADPRIECYTATHIAYRTYAAVMIFVYPLGIPAAFYFLLSRKRSSINPPTDKTLKEQRGTKHVVQEKINKRDNDLSIAPTSFLWNAYCPNRYYYEVFECLRRLVLTGLLVFLVPDTPGQVAFSCVFAFASLLAFELQRPHLDQIETQIYRTGCLVIFFTNFLALMIKAEVADQHSTGSAFYSVVLVMVNIMFFLSIWWNTWATIKLTFTRRGFQGAIVGADVVGEDTVNTLLGPNKKMRRRVSTLHGEVADLTAHSVEDHPAWEDALDDIEARFDSTTSTRGRSMSSGTAERLVTRSGRAPLLP